MGTNILNNETDQTAVENTTRLLLLGLSIIGGLAAILIIGGLYSWSQHCGTQAKPGALPGCDLGIEERSGR